MMDSKNRRERPEFIGYDYREVIVTSDMEALYTDCYKNFGWEIDAVVSSPSAAKTKAVSLRFKRDRKIRNKVELTRLQRNFDSCANDIQAMEKSKFSSASIKAFTVGLIGTAFIAGATFAYLANMIIFCILLAIPGFIGWFLPYFLFQSTYSKKTAAIEPLIEEKYDEIYEVCKNANNLLG